MRWWLLVIALVAACGNVEHSADAAVVERCDPAVALECQGDDLVMCDAEGNRTVQPCALGCIDDERCGEVDATNRLTQFIDQAASGPDLVLPDDTIIDTDDGAVVVDGLPIEIESVLLEAPPVIGGIPVRVLVVRSLQVSGDVFAQGIPALAFVSDGDIAISGGVVRALAGPGIDSAGDGGGFENCNPDPVMATIGGQGGGSYASRGGDGGDVTGGAQGGDPGPIVGTKTIIPLRGGGTNASLQAAGGSIQLVSRTRIEVSDGGAINAGGVGGANNNSGGGSGGGIVLEAPVVIVSGAGSALAANGGGGGCGGGNVTQPAEEGRLDDQRAQGCFSDDEGDGGRGGAGDNPAGMPGQTITGCGVVAGAGGGSVGRIRVSDASGAFAPTDGAIVSPPGNLSNVGVR